MNEIRTALTAGKLSEANTLLSQLIGEVIVELQEVSSIPMLNQISVVSFSRDYPTVAIDLLNGSVRFNPDFWLKYVLSKADLVFLLLHERGHLVLNYMAPTGMVTPFEEDAVINVMVAASTLDSTLTTRLYTDLYKEKPSRSTLIMFLMQPDLKLHTQIWSQSWAQVGEWEFIRGWLHTGYSNAREGYYAALSDVMKFMRAFMHWRRLVVGDSAAPKKGTPGKTDVAAQEPSPLGHEPNPDGTTGEAEKARSEAKAQAESDKASKPTVFSEGSPLGNKEHLSFAGLHIPRAFGTHKLDQFLLGNAPVNTDIRATAGTMLTTAMATALGYDRSDRMYDTTIPSRIAMADVQRMSQGIFPSDWEHNVEPPERKADLYLDFSGSMSPYWPIVLAVSQKLSIRVNRLFGFASTLAGFSVRDAGISVGYGTSLWPVLKNMQAQRNKVVIWVTDLEFAPGLGKVESLQMLENTVSQTERLVVLVPVWSVTSAESNKAFIKQMRDRHFFRLSARNQQKVQIILIDSRGGAHM